MYQRMYLKKVIDLLVNTPKKSRTLIETCLVGLAAGLAAVAFQLGIRWLSHLIYNEKHWSSSLRFGVGTLGIIIIAALIVGLLLNKFCPEAAGSGIPQVKLAFWKNFGSMPRRIFFVKFIAGMIGIGGGLSLGREGPSVQIGGNIGSTIARILRVSKQGRRAAVAAGSAAALAAAFNAPLAGVAFVLEEILEDLNSSFLGSVLLASVIGAFTVHAIIGPDPAFNLPLISEPTWRAYLLMPVVALIASLVGIAFQQQTLKMRSRIRNSTCVPSVFHPTLGAIVTWMLGMAVFSITGKLGVFGIGYTDLSESLHHGLVWQVAGLLLLAKWLSTVTCYASGGCGGIFSPCLFFGAMCGALMTGGVSHFCDLSSSDRILLAVGGMTACLGAVVQAPVTSVLIIFEMTHQFAVLPGLIIAALLSQFIARSMTGKNFYEEILDEDGYKMQTIIPPRDFHRWRNLPVSAIAHFKPVVVDDLTPEGLLKVSQKRHRRFPVIRNNELVGIVTRIELKSSLQEERDFEMSPALFVRPSESIHKVEQLLVESEAGIVVVTDREGGVPLAIVTLHDLMRAQLNVVEMKGS